jgi:hypothetical protein
MGIGLSIFLIAVGAVLNWGVDVDDPSGFNLNTIGVILMVVGAIGLLASMVIWGSHRDRTVVEERREVV